MLIFKLFISFQQNIVILSALTTLAAVEVKAVALFSFFEIVSAVILFLTDWSMYSSAMSR
ncbi:hypothetical protein NQ317_017075 [Molorchus minor]|uniref:NADH dehydrogenase subunit 4L n=1 Tax=Molorchus minor TaxID=1323400 RepID=A0ABQ9K4B5_9CUCU|nr:hypothetical protein NQ317_017075 [Molorchus minor]